MAYLEEHIAKVQLVMEVKNGQADLAIVAIAALVEKTAGAYSDQPTSLVQ